MATVQGNALKETRFTGSEDVERWIKRFEMAVRIDKLSDDEADGLALKLNGPGLTASEKTSAVSIKDALREAYGKRFPFHLLLASGCNSSTAE